MGMRIEIGKRDMPVGLSYFGLFRSGQLGHGDNKVSTEPENMANLYVRRRKIGESRLIN